MKWKRKRNNEHKAHSKTEDKLVWGEHVDKNDCNVRELMSNFRSFVESNRGDSRTTQTYRYADIYRYSKHMCIYDTR